MTMTNKTAKLSRRNFIVATAAAGGGLALGFNMPNGVEEAVAQNGNLYRLVITKR